MHPRKMTDRVSWVGAVDWDRRLFDALIPLPDGTSYNAYLVQGSESTALLDTVNPTMTEELLRHLEDVPRLDYVVAHHAEQDHSGSLPNILALYPEAQVLASEKGKAMLLDLLPIPESRVRAVADGETLSLGDRTLEFTYTPWVHWPETMVSYLQEECLLFTCDFFGSHLATSQLYVGEEDGCADAVRVAEAAKRYYAEIMMPFRRAVGKDLEKVAGYDCAMIAPSHGPVYRDPGFILDAYREWIHAPPRNLVVLPYVTMHDSTARMVHHLVAELVARDVEVMQFDLTTVDLGKLAMALVDAGTIVLGTPTVLGGPHPNAAYAASLVRVLRPKAKFATVIGSYGWHGGAARQVAATLEPLRLELLDPVTCAGLPTADDIAALTALADTIATRHREEGFAAP